MRRINCNIYLTTVYQVAIAFLLLWLTRLGFYYYNRELIDPSSSSHLWRLMSNGMPFDASATVYFNALFLLMRFLPWKFVLRRGYIMATDAVYYVCNSLMLLLNLADIPFFAFQGSRMRFASLCDTFTDPNIAGIMLSYTVEYWWAYLGSIAIIALMVWLSRRLKPASQLTLPSRWGTYSARTALLLLMGLMAFLLMRGTFNFRGARGTPLSIGHAAAGVQRNAEINVVLNTPFCVLRSTSGTDKIPVRQYYSPDELASRRSGIITPADSIQPTGKNLMLIVIESCSAYLIDNLSPLTDGTRLGLMPFLDSLSRQSLTVAHTFATGRRSNEGIVSLLGSFPNYEPFIFMKSSYTVNDFDAFPRLLRDAGYSSTFYYGCNQGSYKIEQIAMTMGVERTVNRETYGNDSDFDGKWGIFDDCMARYVPADITRTLKEPFEAIWFTLSSHAPFTIPDGWDTSGFLNQETGMARSVEYTDQALRIFFDHARQQPWYRNTMFVITADHGNREWLGTKFDTGYLQYHIPFIVYTPDGSIPPAIIDDRVMSQFDIGPTLLGLLGYNRPYVSMGSDILSPGTPSPHYAINKFASTYQITGTRYLVKWDADTDRVSEVYDITADPELTTPLTDFDSTEVTAMTDYAKVLLQDFSCRINSNSLSINSAQ